MGKGIDTQALVKRSEKLAFMQVGTNFIRMEGFTELTSSTEAKEYSRQYVDEDADRTSVTGYAPSISYNFDKYDGNSVHDAIVYIHDNLVTGDDATVQIVQADMKTLRKVGSEYKADGYMQRYQVVPDGDGSTMDAQTYTGTFKANGERTAVTVNFGISTDFQACSVTGAPGTRFTEVHVTGTNVDETLEVGADATSVEMATTWGGGDMGIQANTTTGFATIYAVYNGSTYFPNTYNYINVPSVTAGSSVVLHARYGNAESALSIVTKS
jgi:hypothetical protein